MSHISGVSTRDWCSPDNRLHAVIRSARSLPRALLVCVHGGGCTGRYFDLRGFSFAEQAVARGYLVGMVDRPAYGGSPPPATDRPIAEAAALIARAIPVLVADLLPHGGPVALVGHSIGGAVAIECAGYTPEIVSAVAVSGIGAVPSAAAMAAFDRAQGEGLPDPPPKLFFGPDGTFDWRGPIALRAASAPWRGDELRELRKEWPGRFAAAAEAVKQPVHLRLAEHEQLWETGPQALAGLRRAFAAAESADVAILPGGGHLYEIHKGGLEAGMARLDFLDRALGIA
jgi:pimeloyl-ACP methyl ester carboxylesterase